MVCSLRPLSSQFTVRLDSSCHQYRVGYITNIGPAHLDDAEQTTRGLLMVTAAEKVTSLRTRIHQVVIHESVSSVVALLSIRVYTLYKHIEA